MNNTEKAIAAATLQVHAVRGDGTSVFDRQEPVCALAQAVTASYLVDIGLASAKDVGFVEMELKDAQGSLLSQNFYWYAADSETYRGMNSLPQEAVTVKAVEEASSGGEAHVSVVLENADHGGCGGRQAYPPADERRRADLAGVLLRQSRLSAAGEKRVVEISYPGAEANAPTIAIRGWNVVPTKAEVQAK